MVGGVAGRVRIVAVVLIISTAFNENFTPMPVTLTADRAGLVMEPNSRVKLRGVQVGRVSSVSGGRSRRRIQLDIDPDQIKHIPANVEAADQSTTVFGAKYVDLVYPNRPRARAAGRGSGAGHENVDIEVNTVFQNVVELLEAIDPSKLNAVLAALGRRGERQGRRHRSSDHREQSGSAGS